MNTKETLEDYIPEGHAPNAVPVRELYEKAFEELIVPFPSSKLTRYTKFNHMTGGFRPHEFTILCGPTGCGKTTLLADWSRDFTESGIPHFVASVETGATDFIKRTMSAFVGRDWNTGEALPVEHLQRFHANFGKYYDQQNLWLSLYDNRISVETMTADIAWMVKHRGTKVCFIDNLNFLLEVKRAADQLVEMDRVIHELIIFVKRCPVHIVMVMHPKKTDGGRVESEFDIKGSSTSVQECQNCLLINRPHPDLIQNGLAGEYDRELKIAKMRRRGKFVNKRLILKGVDGTSFAEGDVV